MVKGIDLVLTNQTEVLNQTEFLTNKGINSYLFTEGALDFSPTKRNLLLILREKCHTI